MEQFFYVMAIMGCSDASTACTEARIMPTRYASVQQCRAALPQGVAMNSDLSFPVISGSCRSNTVRIVRTERPRLQG